MIKRITLSIEEDLHKKFQEISMNKGSNVSKEVSLFMQSEVSGREDLVNNLLSTVEDLTDRIAALEDNDSEGGF